jgi:hypothetical protein
MGTIGRAVVIACCLGCLLLGAGASRSDLRAEDFAGTWVLKLGQRNFMVLKLRSDAGRVIGTLSRPAHFQTSDGLRFGQISSSVVTENIVLTVLEKGHLRILVENHADKTDHDEYEMKLTGEGQASLEIKDVVFDPWTIRRVRGSEDSKIATDWDASQVYALVKETDVPNAEMKGIFDADQKARESTKMLTDEDWKLIGKQDDERRAQTKKLLGTGQLHTGKDFLEAALVFQHGGLPEEHLLAHTLAVVSVAKGEPGAAWLSAATLDRYLQSIGRPQIYGTQFRVKTKELYTQEPYERGIVSDALRHQLGVPSMARQEDQLKDYNTPAAKPQ